MKPWRTTKNLLCSTSVVCRRDFPRPAGWFGTPFHLHRTPSLLRRASFLFTRGRSTLRWKMPLVRRRFSRIHKPSQRIAHPSLFSIELHVADTPWWRWTDQLRQDVGWFKALEEDDRRTCPSSTCLHDWEKKWDGSMASDGRSRVGPPVGACTSRMVSWWTRPLFGTSFSCTSARMG